MELILGKTPKSIVRLFVFLKSRMGRGEPCVRLKMVLPFFKELKQANTRFAPTNRLEMVNFGEDFLTLRTKSGKICIPCKWKKRIAHLYGCSRVLFLVNRDTINNEQRAWRTKQKVLKKRTSICFVKAVHDALCAVQLIKKT
jgi:hypothetical protein